MNKSCPIAQSGLLVVALLLLVYSSAFRVAAQTAPAAPAPP
jgi:hypothetical protein